MKKSPLIHWSATLMRHAAPLAAIFAIQSTAFAQLAASGTPGDYAVYTIGSGATLGTGLGTAVTHDFDNEQVADTSNSFSLGADGTADDFKVFLTAGHHLVLFGTEYTTSTERTGVESVFKVNGNAIPYGASAAFTRDATNASSFCRGGTILNVAQGDYIEVDTVRTDAPVPGFVMNQDRADLQLLKLDDTNLEYLRLGVSADSQIMAGSAEGPVSVSYTTSDEINTNSFGHSTSTNPDQITLKSTGHYLVFANTGFSIGTTTYNRNVLTQQLKLNGSDVGGGATTVYLRHASPTDGSGGRVDTGAASIGLIVEVTVPDSILEVEVSRDNNNSASTVSLEAGKTAIAIAKLPSYGDYITLTGPAQDVNNAGATPLDFSTSASVANSSFSYNPGSSASEISIGRTSDYLILASHYGQSDTAAEDGRSIVEQGFQISGGALSYGVGGIYNRDKTTGADRSRLSGAWAGALLPLNAAQSVETTTSQRGGGGANAQVTTSSVGFQALNIASISGVPTNPILATNTGLKTVVSQSTTITPAMLETFDGDNTPAQLTYTLLSNPEGGTLINTSTGVLMQFSTFTQEDINSGRIGFAAGSTENLSGGFFFEVVDPAALQEVEGEFVIAVGLATALGDDEVTIDEDNVATTVTGGGISLLANDAGTNLSVTGFDNVSVEGAAVSVLGDGTFSYDPTAAAAIQALDDLELLTDSFTIEVTDFAGATNVSTVTVNLSGANDVPVLGNDNFAAAESGQSSANVLANDSDVDTNDVLSVTDFDGLGLGTFQTTEGATVTISADGSFVYDPSTSVSISSLASGATLSETFSYTVSDGTATQAASIFVTSTGVNGSSNDVAMTAANATTNVAALANDTVGGVPAVPTSGPVIEFLAANASNTDVLWFNSGATSDTTLSRPVLAGATLLNAAGTPVSNAPVGVTAAYSFTGGVALNDSGMRFIDIGDNAAWGPNGSNTDISNASIELVFRPSDQNGTELLFETGGTTAGTSVVLVGNQIVFTTSDQNGAALQAVATLPANAVAGGDFVHFIGRIDLGTDTIDIILNGSLVATSTGQIYLLTGAPDDLTDWSGTDDGGIGPVSSAIGGDLQLGNAGTIDINGAVDYAGEVAVFRIYESLLDAGQQLTNFEAIFGVLGTAQASDVIDLAGTANPVLGSTVSLPSGALVTFETDGTFTYDPNGAFDHIGVGLTAIDSFEYTLASQPNSTAKVTVIVSGTNTDPQLNIAAGADVTEGSPANFTISSTSALSGPVSVEVSYSGEAQNGADFTGSTTVNVFFIPFPLSLTTIDDSLFEGAENLIVTMESVSAGAAVVGAMPAAELTINDAQSAPEVTLSAVSGAATEGSSAGFMISMNPAADEVAMVTVSYSGTATAGADYDGSLMVPVPAGSANFVYEIPLHEDGLADPGETLTLTIDAVDLGTVGIANSDTVTISDGAGVALFAASFEGVTISPATGVNAPTAADEGTQIGSWLGVPVDTTTGGLPGIVAETDDGKADGLDNFFRLDRPALGSGEVSAIFSAPADFSGSNTATIAFDIGQIRTENDSEAKSARITGLDALGNKAFELLLGASNTGATNEQLLHIDSVGAMTPIGSPSDFENMQNTGGAAAESSMSRVRLNLSSSGYTVAIDRYVIDGVVESISGVLPYAGGATQVAEILFSIPSDLDDAASGGIALDDMSAVGIAGNVGPTLSLDGEILADGGTTAVSDSVSGTARTFSSAESLEVQIADPDATNLLVQFTAVNGLGNIALSPQGGVSIVGANGSATVGISGSVADVNATMSSGVIYTAGAVGGSEIFRVLADDQGSAGAGGAKSSSHDLTFIIFEDPTVSIEQASAQDDPALSGPITFTVVFSETVQGFDDGSTDVDLSGSTTPGTLSAGILEIAPNDGTTYLVSVSGMTGSGNVIAAIPVGAAQRPVSLEDNVVSSSVDNTVEYIQNVQPMVANASQPVSYVSGATFAAINGVIVDDPNHIVQSTIATGETAFVDYPAVDTTENFATTIDPIDTDGLTMEVKFTPEAADVAVGGSGTENRRIIFEIGGSSNGTGLYLIEGIPYFISKMNASAAQTATNLNDLDWSATGGDEMVVVPLSSTRLFGGVPTYVTVIFSLDNIEFSVNGESVTAQGLANRAANNNWAGDNSIGIGLDGPTGGPGGLTNTAGSVFLETDFQSLSGVSPVEYARMWNAISPAAVIETIDRGENFTVSLSVDGYVDVASSGSLSATSGNGESYSAGIWSITGGRDAVNQALAGIIFTFGTSTPNPATVTVTVEDGDEDGSGPVSGKIVFSEQISTVVYVDDDFTGVGGEAIADADLSIGNGNQPAVFLSNAFTNITDALAAVTDTATIVINDGDYSLEAAVLGGTQALVFADTTGGVSIGSLRSFVENTIDLQGNTVSFGGDSVGDVIGGVIAGSGNLIKVGPESLILQDLNTYTGTTTISEGTLRVGYLSGVANGGLGGGGPVVNNGRLEFNVEVDTTMIQTGAISGTGDVATISDGTLIFNGPLANTFSGTFELGDGASSTFDGVDGAIQGFVVVNRGDHLGTGLIRSRGSQLQAGSPGVVIPNNIDVDGGGFRVGGSIDFEFAGNVNSVNNSPRGYGNYGLEGLDLTISGNIDNSLGNINFEGSNGKDNGTWTVTGDISGTGNILVQNAFDGGVITMSGSNTYTGTTGVTAGTLIFNGTHTGGAAYNVNDGVLAGNGTIDAALDVTATGVVNPGPGTAMLSVGALTMAGTLEVDINGATTAGADYDQLVVTGTVDLTGANLNVFFGPSVPAGNLTIIDNDDFLDSTTGEFVNFPAGGVNSAATGWAGSIAYDGVDGNDVEIGFLGLTLLAEWRATNGFSINGSGPGQANSDLAPNGRSNLENFAMGFDAAGTSDGRVLTASGGAITQLGGPQVWRDPADGKIYFQYVRRADYIAGDIIFEEQYSTDLANYSPDFSAAPAVFATGTGDDGVSVEAVQVEMPPRSPISNGPVGFARLAIILDQ